MHPGPGKVLKVTLLLALLSGVWLPAIRPVVAQDSAEPAAVTVTLPTSQDWTATSVVVEAGDQVQILAFGTSPMGPSVPDGTPAGNTSCIPTEQFISADLPCYALIGRIDQSAPFLVGDGVTFNVKLPGELFLGVNDDFFADNEGAWEVTIQVTPTAERQAPSTQATPEPAAATPPAIATETPVAAAPLVGGQQVTLLQGSCQEPLAIAAPVGETTVPTGAFRGQQGALPVASLTAVVPFAFDTLLAGDYAVVVAAPSTEESQVLVCGDLGGAARQFPPESSLGLSPVDDSGWAGIVYLAPNSVDPGSTVLSIFVSPMTPGAPAG